MEKTMIESPRNWKFEKPLYPKEQGTEGINWNTSFGIGDWADPVDGLRTITFPASTHSMVGNFPVRIMENDRITYLDYRILNNGDVVLEIPEFPDYRFAGSIYMGE